VGSGRRVSQKEGFGRARRKGSWGGKEKDGPAGANRAGKLTAPCVGTEAEGERDGLLPCLIGGPDRANGKKSRHDGEGGESLTMLRVQFRKTGEKILLVRG